MNGEEATPAEELLARDLVEFDEALAAGVDTRVRLASETSEEVRQRMQGNVECLRLLRRRWGSSAANFAVATGGKSPASIGRFLIRRELGSGGGGVVFLAYDPKLHREVALKVPRAEALMTPHLRDRFRHEALAAAALDHPNVVPIYEAGEAGPVCYLASAYCPGVTLAQWISDQAAPLDFYVAAELVATLADAVQHAHSRGVLHRDLKPSNVMLVREPNSDSANSLVQYVPKITDFGLAKVDSVDSTYRTHTGVILGTPEYMAPEQAVGKAKDLTTAADIYALGVILYEMLVGRPPFRGETPLETLRQVEHREPPPIGRMRQKTPRDLETIVRKCLEKEPSRRYASADALARDLRCFQAGEPVEARPTPAAERFVRWCRRHKLVAALVLAVVLALGTTATVSTYLAIEANRRGEAEIKTAVAEAIAERASDEQRASRRYSYLMSMLLAQRAWNEADPVRLGELLDEFQPRSPSDPDLREFEWYYWKLVSRRGLLAATTAETCAHCVTFDPRGAKVATGGKDGVLRIYDAKTGQELKAVRAHEGPIWSLAYGRDGAILVTASDDASVRIWNSETMTPLRVLKGHNARVTWAAMSSDGRMIASTSEDATVVLWDTQTWSQKQVLRGHEGTVWSATFTPDSTRLVTCGEDRTVRFWEAATGMPTVALRGHTRPVYRADFSPDGAQLATAADDGTTRVWDAKSGRLLRTLSGNIEGVRTVSFNPAGDRIATGARDRTVRVWNSGSGALEATFHGPASIVDAVAFSADGQRLAATARDGTIWLWDVAGSQQSRAIRGHRLAVYCVAPSSDGHWIASAGSDAAVRVWKAEPFEMAREFNERGVQERGVQQGYFVAFSRDGRQLAAVGANGIVKIWQWPSGEAQCALPARTASVQSLAFDPSGERVATASADGHIRLFSAIDGALIRNWLAHVHGANSVTFSPDGRFVASGGNDRTARLWSAATGQPLASFVGHAGDVYHVAFSPDAQLLASASHDTTARIWHVQSGQAMNVLKGHSSIVKSVTFSPNGRRIATASVDHTVRLWDTHSGNETLVLGDHETVVLSAAFSASGELLISGDMNGQIRIWPASTSR